jgi:hypothetical protein
LDIFGTAENSITYEAFWDPANAVFGQINQIASTLGPFGPGLFAGSTTGAGFGNALYSITQVVNITHSAAGVTQFEASLIPEPALLSLFGLGLAGFGIAAKRRRAKVQVDGLA